MGSQDYLTKNTALLREIVIAAESRLEAQLTLATAADQRALVFAGFVAAIAVALVGGVGSLAVLGKGALFMWIGGLVSVALGASLLCAVMSARPVDWYLPGTTPKLWVGDIGSGKLPDQMLAELLDDLNDRIVANDAIIVNNAALLGRAANIAAAAVTIGTLAALIAAASGQN